MKKRFDLPLPPQMEGRLEGQKPLFSDHLSTFKIQEAPHTYTKAPRSGFSKNTRPER